MDGAEHVGEQRVAVFKDQITRAYNLIARQTTLLVLDNFESLSKNEQRDILEFLRNSPMTLKVVITSRERVSDGQIIRLQGLSFEESNALLDWESQQKHIHLTSDQSKYLIDLTGRLPLALLWVQGQIAVLGYSVTQVLDKLSIDVDIPILQYCFNHSWNLLGGPDARKLLFMLALQPDAVSRAALKEIANIESNDDFENAISELSATARSQSTPQSSHPWTKPGLCRPRALFWSSRAMPDSQWARWKTGWA